MPSTEELLLKYPHFLLHFIDHSSLGSHSFSKERGKHFPNPQAKFWTLVGPPLNRNMDEGDYTPYREPSGPKPPLPLGVDEQEPPLNVERTLLIPDQMFERDTELPPLHWSEHARPRRPPPDRDELPPSSPIHHPPGRPPDSTGQQAVDSDTEPRGSSPDLLSFSDL